MAGRRTSGQRPVTFAQTPGVTDKALQRAIDVLNAAIHDLQAKREPLFTSTASGIVPPSSDSASEFLAGDGTWRSIVGAGAVDSVTAGSSAVSVSPTVGAVVVDVVEANFSGIPESAITFSGTTNVLQKISGTSLVDSTVTDTGSLVTVANPLAVTGTLDVTGNTALGARLEVSGNTILGSLLAFTNDAYIDSAGAGTMEFAMNGATKLDISTAGDVRVYQALTVNGAVDFDSTLDVDGAANFDSTVTLSTMTAGSVFFAGVGGLVSQDNSKFFWDDTNDRLGLGTGSPQAAIDIRNNALTSVSIGRLQSTYASGNSSFDFYDEGNTNRFGIGYDNLVDRAQLSMNNSTPFVIVDNVGGQRVKFFNNGNVNIGGTTTDPGVLLYVEGDTTVGHQLLVRGENTNTVPTPLASFETFVGRTNAGASAGGGSVKNDVAFNWGGSGGGFRHWISTWHDSVANSAGNRINFYLNNGTTAGASSAPGTNNQLVMTLQGVANGGGVVFGNGGVVTNSAILNEFRRDTSNNLAVSSYGTGVEAQILMLSGRGTGASPTALASGDSLGLWSFTGATGASTIFGGALIRGKTTEAWGANVGAKLEFSTTKNASGTGGRAIRLTLDHDGAASFVCDRASGGSFSSANTNTSGAAEILCLDNTSTFKVALGYANASFSDSSRNGKGFLWRAASTDFVIGRSGANVDATIFSNGNLNLGTSTSDPGVKLKVEGALTATGATILSSTLGVTGLATLTAGFSLGADSSAASHKITNLTNGSSAQDAAAFGQIATAVSAAVSGTSGRSARFSGANAVGTGAFTDDGTNATAQGTLYSLGTLWASFGSGAGTSGFLKVGADFEVATTAQNALGFTALSDGNNYIDSKTFSGGSTFYRCGSGAETGFARNWLTLTNGSAAVNLHGDLAINTNKFTVAASNGNTSVAGTLGVSGAATLGDSDTDNHLANGTLSVKTTGADSATGLYIQNDAVLWSLLVDGSNADRFRLRDESAGRNIFTASASDGVVEFFNGASINGNLTAGDSTVAGTLGVTGLATLTAGFSLGADSSAASHKITNLTNGSSAQDAAAFGQIATAVSAAVSGTTNTIAKFTAANVVGSSSITDDGTTFATANHVALFGSSDTTYIRFDSLNFGYDANAAYTGLINHTGYNAGITQFRNLQIRDGKNGTIATFTGSSKQVDFMGAVTVGNNTTLGSADSNTTTVRGDLYVTKTAADTSPVTVYTNDAATWWTGIDGSSSDAWQITEGGVATWMRIAKTTGLATFYGPLTVTGATTLNGNATICDGSGDTLKFYGGTGATQQTITGSRGGNAALADLLTKLATLGVIVDGTSA